MAKSQRDRRTDFIGFERFLSEVVEGRMEILSPFDFNLLLSLSLFLSFFLSFFLTFLTFIYFYLCRCLLYFSSFSFKVWLSWSLFRYFDGFEAFNIWWQMGLKTGFFALKPITLPTEPEPLFQTPNKTNKFSYSM